jgi:DNA-binding transcriptional LysR family regulator
VDQLTAMRVFRRVVELQSFSAAARDLSLSNAAVSKNMSELESLLGVQLINRTTRRMSVTESGRAYYSRCVQILDDIAEANVAVGQLGAKPRGTLRVNAPMSFGLRYLAPAVPEFLVRYRDVAVDLVMNDRYVDLIEEGFDVAVRGGGLLADRSHIARKIMPLRRVVCGAPEYFDRHGTPVKPEDLKDHSCLIYSLSHSPREWHFTGTSGPTTVSVSGPYQVSSSLALYEAVRRGRALPCFPGSSSRRISPPVVSRLCSAIGPRKSKPSMPSTRKAGTCRPK